MTDSTIEFSGGESLLRFVNMLLRRRRWLLLLPMALAILVVGIGLLRPRNYSASASFAPQAGSGPMSRLSGLAAQFGVVVPTDVAAQSPEFYADLLRSPQLLRDLVSRSYRIATPSGDTVVTDLIREYRIAAKVPGRAREKAVKRLASDIRVTTDRRTGVVGLTVTAKRAELSLVLVDSMLELVNRFNLETRQSQAAAERRFAESRSAAVLQELRKAEDELQEFLQRNRDFRNSPQLTFAHDRLQREVQLRQQLYVSLSQAFEQSRIEEVRNTPVITIIERPILPVRPDGRRLALKAMLTLVVGIMVTGLVVTAQDLLRRREESAPDQAAEFRRLLAEVRQDLRKPRRLFTSGQG